MNKAGGFLKGLFSTKNVQKRAGLFVSRPVLNAQSWADWATKHGVPNVLAPEDMHVTIIGSRTDVMCAPQAGFPFIERDRGILSFLGADETVLAFLFRDWYLSERHFWFRENGAVSDWPEYRPHMTISYDAAGWEPTPEALKEMPPSVVMGPEAHEGFNPSAMVKKAMASTADADVFTPSAAVITKVKEALEQDALAEKSGLDPIDGQTMDLLALGLPVTKVSAERLEGSEFAKSFGESAVESAGAVENHILKFADEEQIAYGWASVSILKGALLEDLHEEGITTQALKQLCHGLIRGQRAGKFNHVGTVKADIVEALVITKELMDAICKSCKVEPVDLGREGLFIGMHVPDPADWAIAKTMDMFSIGARVKMIEVDQ